jgi:glutamyl-tRNA reductase
MLRIPQGSGTTEILAQVKEAVLSIDEEAATTTHSDALATPFSNAKYNRYESQVITNKNSCKGSSCFKKSFILSSSWSLLNWPCT